MEEDNFLDRPLKLLSESVGSPSTGRPNYTSPSWQKSRQWKFSDEANSARNRISDVRDLSITMNTEELSGLLKQDRGIRDSPKFGSSKNRLSTLRDLSLTMNASELSGLLQKTLDGTSNTESLFKSGLQDVTLTKPIFGQKKVRESDIRNLSITMETGELMDLVDGSSGTTLIGRPLGNIEESEQLYLAFLETLQSHQSSREVFDTIANFALNCSNVLDIIRENTLKGLRSKYFGPLDTKWLEMERNNWRLLYCLFQNRLSAASKPSEDDINMDIEDTGLYVSEKEVVQNLYKADNGIREWQLVVDWLEKNAADEYEGSVKPRIGHYMDKTVAWENTLHQLQNKDIVYTSSRPIITSLDPDAPLRHGENGHLHDLDIEDEARLLEQMFFEIRCGRLNKAQELCTHCGQSWRAATLEGWKLYHDPNYSSKNTLLKLPVEGNPTRDMWKRHAWSMADNQRLSLFDRAIYGVLCGNLSAVLCVCKGWEDFLWAYTRVLIDHKVEKEIRSNIVKQYADMPDSFWNLKLSMSDIFTELAASKLSDVRQESQSPERVIQKLLILNKIPELISKMLEWVQSGDCKPQMIRFFAHLVLALRLMGQGYHEDKGNEILKVYVQVLMKQGDPQLVAYYTATLPQDDQVTLYADFLETVTDSAERKMCIEAAESVDLQVEAITQRVVENIRNKEQLDEQLRLELSKQTTKEDLEKISALEWVVMYPQQRAEAMWQANAIIRRFLSVGKLEAARMAFNKIPLDSVGLILTQYQIKQDEPNLLEYENLPTKVSAAVREYLCHKAYLDAQEGFSDWFHHYHHAKPKAPAKPKEGASFTDKVAYDHRLAQYNKELDRWKAAMTHQTKNLKSQLYNVLLFPDGGWLVDLESEDKLRQQQMKSLRSVCIPKITLLLHTVLFNMNEHTEAIQLADLIISDHHKLYKVYSKQQLRELLPKLTDSSKALLNQGKDPWGCPVTS